MKIILIGNKARMGKDTFANMLKEELNERAVIIHFADALKFVCKSYYGWNGEKNCLAFLDIYNYFLRYYVYFAIEY